MTVALALRRGERLGRLRGRVAAMGGMLQSPMRQASPPILAACCLLCSCGPSATEGGFDSANPAARMYAIEDAAREGDRSSIGELIELLDSDDPAVRLMAIDALQRLTGQTYGFRHYDSAMQRRESIARWVQAYESGSIQPMTSGPPAAPAPPTPADPNV